MSMGNILFKRNNEKVIEDEDLVSSLANYLHTIDDLIRSGKCKLRLSTFSLTLINELLDQLPGLTACLESARRRQHTHWRLACGIVTRLTPAVVEDIVFIEDIIVNVQHLQLSSVGGTIQGYVDLSKFSALRSLELRSVPIHLVQHIKKFRSTLQQLAVFHCVENARSLLELCGGDQSFPGEWASLNQMDLRYNNLTQIDSSVQLLSAVTILDLSRNAIKDTHGLQYLERLETLNLSYNFLREVPRLSFEALMGLKVLLLNCNHLDSLRGIEQYSSLEVLDVRDNCLILCCDIRGLCRLHHVREIRLLGNPLTMEKNYRLRVLDQLSPDVSSKLILNGSVLSKSERTYLPTRPAIVDPILEEVDPLPSAQRTSTLEHSGASWSRAGFYSADSVFVGENAMESSGSDADVSSNDAEVATYFRDRHQLLTSETTHRREVSSDKPSSSSSSVVQQGGDPHLVNGTNGAASSQASSQSSSSRTGHGPGPTSNDMHAQGNALMRTRWSEERRREGQRELKWSEEVVEDEEREGVVTGERFPVWLEQIDSDGSVGGEAVAVVGKQRLLTVTHAGRVLDNLDLQLLDGLKRLDPLVRLFFRYRNTKYRARAFRFKDTHTLERFVSLVQVHLIPSTSGATVLTCHNCRARFLEGRAERRPISISGDDDTTGRLLCPFCRSNKLTQQTSTNHTQPSRRSLSPGLSRRLAALRETSHTTEEASSPLSLTRISDDIRNFLRQASAKSSDADSTRDSVAMSYDQPFSWTERSTSSPSDQGATSSNQVEVRNGLGSEDIRNGVLSSSRLSLVSESSTGDEATQKTQQTICYETCASTIVPSEVSTYVSAAQSPCMGSQSLPRSNSEESVDSTTTISGDEMDKVWSDGEGDRRNTAEYQDLGQPVRSGSAPTSRIS